RDHDRAITRRDAFRTGAWISFGAATFVAGTGLFMYLADSPPSASRSQIALVPGVGPGFAGLVARGSLEWRRALRRRTLRFTALFARRKGSRAPVGWNAGPTLVAICPSSQTRKHSRSGLLRRWKAHIPAPSWSM